MERDQPIDDDLPAATGSGADIIDLQEYRRRKAQREASQEHMFSEVAFLIKPLNEDDPSQGPGEGRKRD